MELKAFDTRTAANEGRRCTLRDAKGNETDAVLILAGSDSDIYRLAEQAAVDDRFERGRDATAKVTMAELQAETLDRLVRCTLGWEGLTEDGAPVPFTAPNVRQLYETAPAVRDQAWAFIHARANFAQPSKPD